MATNGLVLIKPTSTAVTGGSASATINAGGSVTFTTCETLSLNGVFSSAYDNYIIDISLNGTYTDGTTYYAYRTAGTDARGNDYTSQYIDATNTTVSGARLTSETVARFYLHTSGTGNMLFVYGPNLAQPTAARSVGVNGVSSARLGDYATTHSLSTAYDGITFLRGVSGTMSGLIKVYGLVK